MLLLLHPGSSEVFKRAKKMFLTGKPDPLLDDFEEFEPDEMGFENPENS